MENIFRPSSPNAASFFDTRFLFLPAGVSLWSTLERTPTGAARPELRKTALIERPAAEHGEALSSAADLTQLYERYGRAVYRRCQYFLGQDETARDAMHDVFVKVVERYHEFRGASSALTWLIRISTNHCLNLLRARNAAWHERYHHTVQVDLADRGPAEIEAFERRHLIRRLLATVGEDQQQAAIFYWVDEMNQAEAAAAAGCSVPTLRKRLRGFVSSAERFLGTPPGGLLPLAGATK